MKYVGARTVHSSVNINYFQPTQATQDKCNAWLLTSSSHAQGIMQVDPDTIQAFFNSLKPIEVSDLPEYLLRVCVIHTMRAQCSDAIQPEDILSLPHF